MSDAGIHSQLQADCHQLGQLPGSTFLLHRNARLPWFILVPKTDAIDLLDLPEQQLREVMQQCQQLSSFLKVRLGHPKVNFGALGNLVPQLHLHIIGRAPGDDCWPQPVWGNLEEGPAYSSDTLADWTMQLTELLGLKADV